MIAELLFLISAETATPAEAPATSVAPSATSSEAPVASESPTSIAVPQQNVKVEKQVIYQKDQVVDLTGSTVEGENSAPPAFFVTKMQTPNAKSLLQERLDAIRLRDYNLMGF